MEGPHMKATPIWHEIGEKEYRGQVSLDFLRTCEETRKSKQKHGGSRITFEFYRRLCCMIVVTHGKPSSLRVRDIMA